MTGNNTAHAAPKNGCETQAVAPPKPLMVGKV